MENNKIYMPLTTMTISLHQHIWRWQEKKNSISYKLFHFHFLGVFVIVAPLLHVVSNTWELKTVFLKNLVIKKIWFLFYFAFSGYNTISDARPRVRPRPKTDGYKYEVCLFLINFMLSNNWKWNKNVKNFISYVLEYYYSRRRWR